MVSKFLRQAPYWTAMRCRVLFWHETPEGVTLDVVMSGDQPDGADWDTPAGSPFTVVVAATSPQWVGVARDALDRWVSEGQEIELRRTRGWEEGAQVLIWGPDASLLVALAE